MPRNSSRSIKTRFAPLDLLIRNSLDSPSMAIEYTSATTPTELTIAPLVVSSPCAHRLRNDFPSDDYVLELYAILANPRLAPAMEPHLDIGSPFFALFHLHQLAIRLHSATQLTSHPDSLRTSILSIHEDLLSHIHQLFHQLGLDNPDDLLPRSPH